MRRDMRELRHGLHSSFRHDHKIMWIPYKIWLLLQRSKLEFYFEEGHMDSTVPGTA